MVAAMEAGADQLDRLARSHADVAEFSSELDSIANLRKLHSLGCVSELQRAAVALDAQGAYLGVLVRLSDKNGKWAASLKDIGLRRTTALAKAENVLEELRESSYHNLLLWDRLLRCQEPQK